MSGTTSNFLFDTPDNIDVDEPDIAVDSRLRVGYPQLKSDKQTQTDLSIARAATESIPSDKLPEYDKDDKPIPPELSDPLADIKRALSYQPDTGVGFITGADISAYSKGNFDARVADGSVLFQAVDQDFKQKDGTAKPGLTYLRLGKPEAQLKDKEGNEPTRKNDQLMDEKYGDGVGLYSDGGLRTWTKQAVNLRSNEEISMTAPSFYSTSYGKRVIVSYEIEKDSDIELINSGKIEDTAVNRKIINVEAMKSTDLGWYKQVFDRGRNLEYSTSNKGEFGIGSSYGMSVGSTFEHSIAASLETSYTAKVGVGMGLSIEIGPTGSEFKHPFGSWTHEEEAETTALSKISLAISGVEMGPMKTAITVFAGVLQGAVAAQSLAFTAYNAILAGMADRTLTAEDTKRAEGDEDKTNDTYRLLSALDQGMLIYEVALSLSAISCAAGITLGALEALWMGLKKPTLATPDIEVSTQGIFLRYGGNGIQIDATGIKITGLAGGVQIGGPTVDIMSPAANFTPAAPQPIPPRT